MGNAVAVTKAFFLRFEPPREAYARLEKYPPILGTLYQKRKKDGESRMKYLPKRDQQTIMTVASDPRLEGERNPNNAKTMNPHENLE